MAASIAIRQDFSVAKYYSAEKIAHFTVGMLRPMVGVGLLRSFRFHSTASF